MTTDMDQLIREQARLIILKGLREQVDEHLNSDLMLPLLASFGIRKGREWVHVELEWLADIGAVKLTRAGTILVAALTERGAQHLDRVIAIEGVKRPSREG
jgi:hypothetical protein